MAVRQALIARYKPGTVNKMLSALRGVLKQAWRLGLIEADTYHRAAGVESVRATNLLSDRVLETDGIGNLFEVCANAEYQQLWLVPASLRAGRGRVVLSIEVRRPTGNHVDVWEYRLPVGEQVWLETAPMQESATLTLDHRGGEFE